MYGIKQAIPIMEESITKIICIFIALDYSSLKR